MHPLKDRGSAKESADNRSPINEALRAAQALSAPAGTGKEIFGPVTPLLVLLVVLAVLVAYSPILFNFFLGDDFVHLTWLKEAIKTPELVWRNFHSSWLDGTTTRFYRPLISVFMVTDYAVWKTNGLGFHITNVLFHLAATVMRGFAAGGVVCAGRGELCLRVSGPDRSTAGSQHLYPLAVSLIFGLYPLHCEAVSWITGRVDAIVTAFYITTFYCYLRWRDGAQKRWFALAMVAFVLGLLSKEMALTLPPAFLLYELTLGKNALWRAPHQSFPGAEVNRGDAENNSLRQPLTLIEYCFSLVKPTILFWSMLVVYFAVRRMALGTFVGGYDDSLFFIADIRNFIGSWLHGLRMFLVPLNKGLMGSHHVITKLWETMLAVSFSLAAWNILKERKLLRLLAFNLLFLALCFAPVYKIFTIADDLQGARLAHVATLALSLLLAMAFIAPSRLKSAIIARWAILLGVASICGVALWINNLAWARAGEESNAIRAGLSKLYTNIEGDPQVLLISLPDQVDGAYICRNALWGMTKSPQMQRDVMNCLMLNRYEQILPFGFLKQSLLQCRDSVKLYSWNSLEKQFKPLSIVSDAGATPPLRSKWILGQLRDIASDKNGKSSWSTSRELIVRGDSSKDGRPEVLIDFGKRSCFDIEFVRLHVRNLDTTGGSKPFLASEGIDLLYANDISPKFDLPNRTHADFDLAASEQDIVLPLRSLPEWSLGGNAHPLQLRFPHECELAIKSVEIVAADQLMPSASFPNSGYMGTKGYLHLSDKDKSAVLAVDGTTITDAAGIVLEITRPNLMFETQNTKSASKVSMKEIKAGTRDSIRLTRDMFPSTGMYEARPWAVDASGNKLGVAGDHIVISVDF